MQFQFKIYKLKQTHQPKAVFLPLFSCIAICFKCVFRWMEDEFLPSGEKNKLLQQNPSAAGGEEGEKNRLTSFSVLCKHLSEEEKPFSQADLERKHAQTQTRRQQHADNNTQSCHSSQTHRDQKKWQKWTHLRRKARCSSSSRGLQ